jgi:hypothetical protein
LFGGLAALILRVIDQLDTSDFDDAMKRAAGIVDALDFIVW